ncbi:hypothetical protein DL95DRAFT_394488 [Leptodontidium sp. 2 PMI_412]|nr:hypothetical protein DL95DRAFT_394488 [Leptodontidium sp. 2 PMI_412]
MMVQRWWHFCRKTNAGCSSQALHSPVFLFPPLLSAVRGLGKRFLKILSVRSNNSTCKMQGQRIVVPVSLSVWRL